MYLSSSHIDSWTYKRLLRASDCFVLPSRGEGWGMPATEAMSMGLPVIVTNWSGTADIVDESVGSLLPFKLTKVPESEPWWFYDAEWADADVTALRKAMRHYYDHSDESARKGRTARQRMIDFYSPAAVSRALVRELERIKSKLRSKECKSCFNSTYVAKPGDELKPIGYSDEDIFLVKPSERETRRRILEAQSQSLLSFGSKDPHRKLNLWLVVICILLPFSVMIICTLLSHK